LRDRKGEGEVGWLRDRMGEGKDDGVGEIMEGECEEGRLRDKGGGKGSETVSRDDSERKICANILC